MSPKGPSAQETFRHNERKHNPCTLRIHQSSSENGTGRPELASRRDFREARNLDFLVLEPMDRSQVYQKSEHLCHLPQRTAETGMIDPAPKHPLPCRKANMDGN